MIACLPRGMALCRAMWDPWPVWQNSRDSARPHCFTDSFRRQRSKERSHGKFLAVACCAAVASSRPLRMTPKGDGSGELPKTLKEMLDVIQNVLATKRPQQLGNNRASSQSYVLLSGVPRRHSRIRDHELGPFVPKPWWTHLGKLLSLALQHSVPHATGTLMLT